MQKCISLSIISTTLAAIMVILISISSLASERYELVAEWGSSGSEDGQFYEALGLAIDSENNLYLADSYLNHRIQKFTSDGEFITSWGNYGSGDGEFISPEGIDVDDEGNVYVADFLNDRVQKFTSEGEFITKWGMQVEGVWTYSTSNALTVDNSGNVFVHHVSFTPPSLFKNTIQKFTTDGVFIKKWGFIWLESLEMATDREGNLYVPAAIIGPVQVFNSEGELIDELKTCSIQEAFCTNTGIAIDDEGNVFVSDMVHHRIKKFTKDGELITKWNLEGPEGFGTKPSPFALAVDNEGHVYVIDNGNVRIQKYAKVSETTTTINGPCLSESIYGKDSAKTKLLRRFRDNVLGKTPEGKEIISLYYEWSPSIVKAMEADDEFTNEVKEIIDKMLPMIEGAME